MKHLFSQSFLPQYPNNICWLSFPVQEKNDIFSSVWNGFHWGKDQPDSWNPDERYPKHYLDKVIKPTLFIYNYFVNSRSHGCGLDDPDFGGGSIVDLMLQPKLHDEEPDRVRDKDDREDDDQRND